MKEHKGLSYDAYEEIPGDEYQPYAPKNAVIPEFTVRAVILGAFLGILFAAANAYIGLKVGLTVSASIPIAVMAVAVFRAFAPVWGKATILENNMTQTIGSAGESLAAGMIFTIPALILWNLEPDLMMMFVIALLGGLLGVLFMIPLRRYLINREHGKLPYPEGTACAEVLVAGDMGGSQARHVFAGLGISAVYKLLMSGLGLWKSDVHVNIPAYKNAMVSVEVTPALLGIGYILGYRIAAIMVGGSLISWLILIPIITIFGDQLTSPLFPEQKLLIGDMEPYDIWNRYIRYIGAGAVAFGGIITLIRALPTIVRSFQLALKEILQRVNKTIEKKVRTDRDVSLVIVAAGAVIIGFILWLEPFIPVGLLGALLIVLFSFFFVTVSSRICGLIGSSSNPISGMTIATLLVTSLIFAMLGMTDMTGKVAALTVGAVVCMSAAVAGDTSQDLKTGFLVGATPIKQQMGEMIGVLTSALVIGAVILQLHSSLGIGSRELPAPQATLMALVIEGVLSQNLPWGLIFIGIFLGAIFELFHIPSLPMAVGLYLPLATMAPVFMGGCMRVLIEKRSAKGEMKANRERGVLFTSGLIAGDGLIGVLLAFIIGWFGIQAADMPVLQESMGVLTPIFTSRIFAFLLFSGLAFLLYRTAFKKES